MEINEKTSEPEINDEIALMPSYGFADVIKDTQNQLGA
jgi:hypothetical protein